MQMKWTVPNIGHTDSKFQTTKQLCFLSGRNRYAFVWLWVAGPLVYPGAVYWFDINSSLGLVETLLYSLVVHSTVFPGCVSAADTCPHSQTGASGEKIHTAAIVPRTDPVNLTATNNDTALITIRVINDQKRWSYVREMEVALVWGEVRQVRLPPKDAPLSAPATTDLVALIAACSA